MFTVGSTVIHPIHGLGTVQNISEQEIMGQRGSFATIYFEHDKITINVRAEGEGTTIRPLIEASEIPAILEHMKTGRSDLPSGASERFSVSMKKYKSNNIILMAEAVRDLTRLALDSKITPKELTLLKQIRHAVAIELACAEGKSADYYEDRIDEICRDSA